METVDQVMTASGVQFGTSGARGLVAAMTDRVCYLYAGGFLRWLAAEQGLAPGDEVVVGIDLRPSSPRIARALLMAIADAGYRPVYVGVLPTPAVLAYGLERGCPSLMVTGSHIPFDRNGIKFHTAHGEILKSDEMEIRAQLVEVPPGRFDARGNGEALPALPGASADAAAQYRARWREGFANGRPILAGRRVLVYEHSSAARDLLAGVLAELGAEVVRVGRTEAFVPIDTEAVSAADRERGRLWADEHGCDAIVSTDGDGDRPLVADERGEWFRGDIAGLLTARYLDADAVATPVSSNTALELSGWFPRVLRTRIGSPYVVAAMSELAEEGAERVVGYEANGGFLLQQDLDLPGGGRLRALPSRDAVIVILSLLGLAVREGRPLSELRGLLPARFTASDRLQDSPPAASFALIRELESGGTGGSALSALHPALESIARMDTTDGLRLDFDSGAIVHFRQSGNAPELRCYAEAADQELAAELVRLGLDWAAGHLARS